MSKYTLSSNNYVGFGGNRNIMNIRLKNLDTNQRLYRRNMSNANNTFSKSYLYEKRVSIITGRPLGPPLTQSCILYKTIQRCMYNFLERPHGLMAAAYQMIM